jgi:hypothetical protein
MTKLPENLDLTVAQLCLSPQQLVLALRHGAQDESGKFEQREIYHALQSMLSGRELRDIKVPIRIDDISFILTVNRLYEHKGNIYRLVIAGEERMAHLGDKKGGKWVVAPTESDELVLNLSRYLVFQKTGHQVEKLYVTYHVVSPMQEIMEQYVVEVPAWDFSRVERELKARVLALRAAMALPDNRLPACTESEKWVSKGVAYNCAVQCPSRGVCFQKRDEFAKLLQVARSMGTPLGEDGPVLQNGTSEPEMVIVEEQPDPTSVI